MSSLAESLRTKVDSLDVSTRHVAVQVLLHLACIAWGTDPEPVREGKPPSHLRRVRPCQEHGHRHHRHPKSLLDMFTPFELWLIVCTQVSVAGP